MQNIEYPFGQAVIQELQNESLLQEIIFSNPLILSEQQIPINNGPGGKAGNHHHKWF